MSFEDVSMDVLLRRYAKRSGAGVTTEHLDADELNAFAEGSIPDASRARYVSHLADCEDCRRLVAQLSIAAGAVTKVADTPATAPLSSWRERLANLFKVQTLRYAAFALILVTGIGIVALFFRHRSEPAMIARNEPEAAEQPRLADSKSPPVVTTNGTTSVDAPSPNKNQGAAVPAAPIVNSKTAPTAEESKALDGSATDQKPPKAAESVTVTGKQGELATVSPEPSYAPAPPEIARAQTQSNTQQNGARMSPGSQTQSLGTLRNTPRNQVYGNINQDKSANETVRVNSAPEANTGRSDDSETRNSLKDSDNLAKRKATDARTETKEEKAGRARANESGPKDEATRSIGGHKFHRQGDVWVDSKYKSSMTLKVVTRGSEEFASLDGGLRSIAQQLSGELIIVWKGKAYSVR